MTEKITVPDLFVEAKKAVNQYQSEVHSLDAQESELTAELLVLQQELTGNMLSQEGASVSDRVYLRLQGKEISTRSDIITGVLAELEEERHELKLKYVPVFTAALTKDRQKSPSYSAKVKEIVDGHLYAALEEVADISKQIGQQHTALAGGINDVFQDEKANEIHRNLRYRFGWDSYKPSFSNFGTTVLNRHHVDYATGGAIHPDFKSKKPKEGARQ